MTDTSRGKAWPEIFTIEAVLPIVSGIPPLKRKAMLRRLELAETGQAPAAKVFCIWVADFLYRFAPLEKDEIELVLETFQNDLQETGEKIWSEMAGNSAKVSVPVLSILDRSYAGLSGRRDFLNLKTGDVVGKPERPMIEAVTYNLTAVASHYIYRYRANQFGGQENGGFQSVQTN